MAQPVTFVSLVKSQRRCVWYESEGELRRALTGRVSPMVVRRGAVGRRAVGPERGVAFTTVRWRERDGASKLTVRTCSRRRAEGA